MSQKSVDFFNQKMYPQVVFRKKGDREADLQKNTAPRPQPVTYRDKFVRAGSPAFDVDRYIDSEFGDRMIRLYENFAPYEHEDDPAVFAFWERLGLRKEIHNAADPERKWVSFVPLEAAEHPERSYPVVFCIHGNGTSLFAVETYGYCHLAAEEKFIVIIPQDAEDTFDALYQTVLRDFPADPSRIYLMGFSYGGWIVNKYGIEWVERFAAGCSGGVIYNGYDGNTGYRQMHFTDAQRANAREKHFPIAFITGLQESNLFLPYHKQKDEVTNLREKLLGTIFWRDMNGCAVPSFEEAKAISPREADSVEMTIGCRLDRTWVELRDGVIYYFGAVSADDGIERVLHVGIENGPHCPSPSFARISWDFMKHFSRDPETGRSVYTA